MINSKGLDKFRPQFLDLKNENWQDCLIESFLFLSKSWDNNWIGLPQLIKDVLDWLKARGVIEKNPSNDAILMFEIAIKIAELIEKEAAESNVVVDHPYHNRLHFAQVITSVGIQSAIESIERPDENGEWIACLILSAVGHDYKHDGSVNQFPMELEKQSVQALLPVFVKYDLAEKWKFRIKQIILNTDVPASRLVHACVKDCIFKWDLDWASILVIESDNMASVHPQFGRQLSTSLSVEWMLINNIANRQVATVEGRKGYLSNITFTSYSSRVLGVQKIISQQLNIQSSKLI